MKIKTSELKGRALDLLVARCRGLDVWKEPDGIYLNDGGEVGFMYRPSTDWAHGGPIIEREMIELVPQSDSLWDAMYRDQHIPNEGPTPLIAAMRCFVISKLGNEVDIPESLVEGGTQ